MRAIVCGSRNYKDWELLYRVLDGLGITHVIEGGARGADRLAREWALSRLIPLSTFDADWGAHGKAAGGIRNQQMLDEGKPDLVVAFPLAKSSGTWDMVRKAKAANVSVKLIEN